MLARSLFRVCQRSTTKVLVFHFVRERLSVPRSSYLTCQKVNKQPSWFSVPFILPWFDAFHATVKHNNADFENCTSEAMLRVTLSAVLATTNKLFHSIAPAASAALSGRGARRWSLDRVPLFLYDSLRSAPQTLHMKSMCGGCFLRGFAWCKQMSPAGSPVGSQ